MCVRTRLVHFVSRDRRSQCQKRRRAFPFNFMNMFPRCVFSSC